MAPAGKSNARFVTLAAAAVPLGATVFGHLGGEYVFAAAEGAFASGVPGCITTDLSAIVPSTNANGYLGVAEDPFADEDFGWFKRKGVCEAVVASGTAAGARLTVGSSKFIAGTGTGQTDATQAVALEAAPVPADGLTSVFLF
jgi:hypothetical protein